MSFSFNIQHLSYQTQICNPESKPDMHLLGHPDKKMTISEYAHKMLYLRAQKTKEKTTKRKEKQEAENKSESENDE